MNVIDYDCEFLEDGQTIDLISIGMVAEDGREYYAVCADADWGRIADHDWLCQNVVPALPLAKAGTLPDLITKRASGRGPNWIFSVDVTSPLLKPRWVIANEVREFILAAPEPRLWADYSAYDHVALAQLFGRMIDLPAGFPMRTSDLRQEWDRLGQPDLPSLPGTEHNALDDARECQYRRRWLADGLWNDR